MSDPGSSHSLTRENFLTAFPVALKDDPSAAALGDITARLLARRPGEIDRLRIYPVINQLPEDLLDILAYDFKVDWWDPDYTLEEKRRTLADSWRVHKMLGTKAAVETAIRAIYPKTEVQEWFEYEGGEPYHFKLSIDLTDTFGDETRPWRVLERVNFYKSLRSHVDEIVFTMTTKPYTVYVGGGVGAVLNMGIPVAGDEYEFRQSISAGGVLGAHTHVGVPEGADTYDFHQTVWVGGDFGADVSIGPPAGQDAFDFRQELPVGGVAGIHASAGIPQKEDAPQFSRAVHAGGGISRQASFPVPEDVSRPAATTILRMGNVCTIISNLPPKGE